jgi:hypothetical protein
LAHRIRAGDLAVSATQLPLHSLMMNKTESDRIHQLCSLIVVEQDRHKFLELVGELNRILEANDLRLKSSQVGN